VRIGNAAATQFQLDVFGELIEVFDLAEQAGLERTDQEMKLEAAIVRHVRKVWQEADHGMWEERGPPRHHVYSKVMAWVAIDRYCKRAGEDRPKDLIELRSRIHDDICREGYHEGLGTFTSHYGGQSVDASLLLLPLVQFLPIEDERMAATIATIERELVEDGLVRREKPHDPAPEGAFLACTCWLADCQAMQGRHETARKTFERVLSVRNDLGLLAEEYNVTGRHLAGNFPQALSHIALINTALGLCGPVLIRGGG
jgi:GH15 family glucan-1,4-alpha-glucosidase